MATSDLIELLRFTGGDDPSEELILLFELDLLTGCEPLSSDLRLNVNFLLRGLSGDAPSALLEGSLGEGGGRVVRGVEMDLRSEVEEGDFGAASLK